MTPMREYAALHGWEVGAQLRYKDSATPSTITAITHSEVRISTPGDFPGRLTFGPDIDHWKLVMDSVPVSLRARIKQLENSLAEAHSECDDLIAQRDEEARNAKMERTRADDAERERDRLAYQLLRTLDGGDA